jgi:hypothetical protein
VERAAIFLVLFQDTPLRFLAMGRKRDARTGDFSSQIPNASGVLAPG